MSIWYTAPMRFHRCLGEVPQVCGTGVCKTCLIIYMRKGKKTYVLLDGGHSTRNIGWIVEIECFLDLFMDYWHRWNTFSTLYIVKCLAQTLLEHQNKFFAEMCLTMFCTHECRYSAQTLQIEGPSWFVCFSGFVNLHFGASPIHPQQSTPKNLTHTCLEHTGKYQTYSPNMCCSDISPTPLWNTSQTHTICMYVSKNIDLWFNRREVFFHKNKAQQYVCMCLGEVSMSLGRVSEVSGPGVHECRYNYTIFCLQV